MIESGKRDCHTSYKSMEYGVIGKMHQWITEYLRDRKARVKIQDHTSRCHTLKEGVPQSSVLSPTLFSIYINDMQKTIPKEVNAALYGQLKKTLEQPK